MKYEKIEELLSAMWEKTGLGRLGTGTADSPETAVTGAAAAAVHQQIQSSDLAFVKVPADRGRHLIMDLRDHFGFTHLVFLTASDYMESGVFTLTYMLHSYTRHWDIGVQIDLPREGSTMESIHDLWAQAATYQRELREMFGIDFPGSPRIDEPFILEGWDDVPPMRREFDTKEYSERTFFPRPGRSTNDPAGYMRQKLYPKE